MKKFFIIIVYFFVFFTAEANWETKSFTEKQWFELYKNRVENFCSEYKSTNNNFQIIYILDESKYFLDLKNNKKISDWLKEAKIQYEKNMDNIFECATLSSYQRWLEVIKNDLIKQNPKLNSRLKSKIENKITELKNKIKSIEGNCKVINNSSNLLKLTVLNQTTYETCKYNYYLEYLKEFYNDPGNLVDKNQKNESILSITNKNSKIKNAINKEIENIYKVFPIAIQAYNDYENNISNHILLELLKEEYEIFKIWLHKTLNPINQVVYKISNAMKQ